MSTLVLVESNIPSTMFLKISGITRDEQLVYRNNESDDEERDPDEVKRHGRIL
jgi:hypothetical protein